MQQIVPLSPQYSQEWAHSEPNYSIQDQLNSIINSQKKMFNLHNATSERIAKIEEQVQICGGKIAVLENSKQSASVIPMAPPIYL